MRLTPRERAIYIRGQQDGERAKLPMAMHYGESERKLYERGYGRGYDSRYRADAAHKKHGNKRDDARAAR